MSTLLNIFPVTTQCNHLSPDTKPTLERIWAGRLIRNPRSTMSHLLFTSAVIMRRSSEVGVEMRTTIRSGGDIELDRINTFLD